MFNVGPGELIIIMFIALLIFGNRLPEVARNLGRGLTEFKKGMHQASQEVTREIEAAADLSEQQKSAQAQPAHPVTPPAPPTPPNPVEQSSLPPPNPPGIGPAAATLPTSPSPTMPSGSVVPSDPSKN